MAHVQPEHALNAIDAAVRRLRHIARAFLHRFMRGGQLQTAAALTYTTLFAVVPLMTVTYAVLSVLPEFSTAGHDIEQFIFRYFVPEVGEQLRAQLHSFSDQARRLTLWGFLFLFVTSYLLLVNVEKAFNEIWGVVEPRRGVSRFLLYWSVLTFGPPAIAIATAVSSYVLSIPLLGHVQGLDVRAEFLTLLPWLISGVGFSALFYAVPNCDVPLPHAIVGGLVTMLCFHMALKLFALFVTHSDAQVIYGTFAAVPLFLTWIYLCWALVLGGALLVKLLGEPVREASAEPMPALVGALALLQRLHHAHRGGGGLTHDEALDMLEGIARPAALLQQLQSAGLAVRAAGGEWHLGRDLAGVTLWELSEGLIGELGWTGHWTGIEPAIAARYEAAIRAARDHLDISLATLLDAPAE